VPRLGNRRQPHHHLHGPGPGHRNRGAAHGQHKGDPPAGKQLNAEAGRDRGMRVVVVTKLGYERSTPRPGRIGDVPEDIPSATSSTWQAWPECEAASPGFFGEDRRHVIRLPHPDAIHDALHRGFPDGW